MKALTAARMREIDRLTTERYGVPSLELMENAGRGVADYIAARHPGLDRRRVFVLCAKGNNGRGVPVRGCGLGLPAAAAAV